MKIALSVWTTAALTLTVSAGCGAAVKGTSGDDGGVQPQASVTPAGGVDLNGSDDTATRVPAALLGSWTLAALDGAPVPDVGKTPALEILEDGAVSGVSGVNSFRTQLEIDDGRLAFGPAAGTKMAGPPAAMDLETTFLARLAAVSTYDTDGDTLRLWAGDNEALTFTRIDN